MKIGQQAQKSAVDWRARFVFLLAASLLALLLLGDMRWSDRRMPGWLPSLSATGPGAADLPLLRLDIDFADYNRLLEQRQTALDSNVFIGNEDAFVPASVELAGETVPVRLRLRQGVLTDLGPDAKWPFELRTRDDALLQGMERFYLIDPADNNWLLEWSYLRSLEREGLLTVHYQFVRLVINGDDRGIYALQEGFGDQLLTAAGRPAGVIVEFDTQLLWESIIYFGDEAAAIADPVTNLSALDFQSFEVDTFRDAAIADDPERVRQKETAIGLLRGLQSGTYEAAAVFDVERYGLFLALTDLWGAVEATSPVNLRYYFHPSSGRLEPIGFNGNPHLDGGRLSLKATFHDPALQAAYARHAWRVSQPAYLAALRADLAGELARLQEVLRSEHPPEEFWALLSQRQAEMAKSLQPLQPIFAYLGSPDQAMHGTIELDVASVVNLPVEIIGVDVDGATFLPADPAWVTGRTEGYLIDDGRLILRGFDDDASRIIRPVRLRLPLTAVTEPDDELSFTRDPEIRVAARILGLDQLLWVTVRPGYPDS